MILNIGVDIEQASRFRKINKNFLLRFFSKNEIGKIKITDSGRIAGIFCAKEAVIKACTPIEKLHFENIEILHREDNSPYALIKKSKKIKSGDIRLSISHSKDYAVAAAILIK